ncbi:Bardet-Biedl syndrome 2 protein-like isoform X4 [Anopheles merus]|uniref:Bardet-Biedl syndrome 2 protein-like isoform X4 n=1 Tax=Anopheles merus TaxID=30066 RepID=UPI001BE46E61|nr:Bardet-Biedl syndrome 2 protein-like isoform X4 [Anopheles merus]
MSSLCCRDRRRRRLRVANRKPRPGTFPLTIVASTWIVTSPCSTPSRIRGYTTPSVNMLTLHNVADEEMNALLTQKQKLLLELKHYENNIKYNKEILSNTSESNLVQSVPDNVGIIPSNTRLQIGISTSYDSNDMNIDITVSTNNSTTIRVVLIFADQLFKEETLIAHLTKDVSRILIPLKTLKDNAQDIHIKAFVGYPSSVQFHVFELTRQLPKFAMYTIPHNLTGSPKSVYTT